MPRFESEDRFWEIEREGRRIRIRSGAHGEAPEETVRAEHYLPVARRQFEALIRAKLEEGYVPVENQGDSELACSPELEARLLQELDPDGGGDPSIAWSVLGDWLGARGDVRGELVTVDETLRRFELDPMASSFERDRLVRRRRALIDEWSPRWLGDLSQLCGPNRPVRLDWDHGWIAGAHLGTEVGDFDLSAWRLGASDLVPALERLLRHPLAGLLRTLNLTQLDPRAKGDYQRALRVLAEGPRPALCRLQLGTLKEGAWVRDSSGVQRKRTVLTRIGPLDDLERLLQLAPRLRALRLTGRLFAGLPAMPRVRALELHVPRLSVRLLSSLSAGPWTDLERLWIRCTEVYDPWSREQAGDARLRGILSGLSASSKLRELSIQGPSGLIALLENVDSLALRELRLPRLSENTARLLLDGADALSRIERIVVEDGEVEGSWDAVRRRFGSRLVSVRGAFAPVAELGERSRWDPQHSWR
ncbi:WGR domain protein [Plesiocystis pacifica SIR-1]|uniref:WGR domain protein n=1 Tax=Plesiocystis pacifica SIR-1 TaxID=391625 RepID=A6G788_9BACT|nr:hypothetical protein [Plesiocystis pacifica]EDM78222.1 WGR domain protein [Plesiocystis pacifica SIR-1]